MANGMANAQEARTAGCHSGYVDNPAFMAINASGLFERRQAISAALPGQYGPALESVMRMRLPPAPFSAVYVYAKDFEARQEGFLRARASKLVTPCPNNMRSISVLGNKSASSPNLKIYPIREPILTRRNVTKDEHWQKV